MISIRPSRLATLAISVALLVAISAVPAFATRGPVPNDAIVAGKSLKGMSESDARAFIRANVHVPKMMPMGVNMSTKRFTFWPQRHVAVAVDLMLDQAYASRETTASYQLAPRYRIGYAGIERWVKEQSLKVDRRPVNARYVARNRRLYVKNYIPGLDTNVRAGMWRVGKATAREAYAGGATQPRVTVPVARITASVTPRNIGRAILVVEARRRLVVYRNGRIERTFGCAVGMPRYPTPKGTWQVVAKAKNPVWRNPGSGWADGMPSYIPAGPGSPLGTRALYLDAPGIRIHGTYNIGSIGTAASHGCIRMRNGDIERLFPLIPIGTKVFVVR